METVASTVPHTSCDVEASIHSECGTNSESSEATKTKEESGQELGLFRHGGTLPTAVCLSKAAIGAGMLSMSAHAAEVGLLYQLCGLVMGALLTLVSLRLIARASIDTGCWSYEDLCEDLFHPALSLLTGAINVCNCLGSGAGYLIVCGQVFQVVTGAGGFARQLFVLMTGLLVCAPLALARHISFMRYLAAGSVAALLLLLCTVAWYLGERGVDDTITLQTMWFGPGGATVFTYMNSINNIVFAFNNQFNAPQLTGELTPHPTVQRMTTVAWLTTAACLALFSAVSVLGLLAFGVGAAQGDSLVIDLEPARRSPLVLASLLAVMFSVLTCFQFHVYPIRQFAAWLARKARGRGKDEEATDLKLGGRSVTRWLDIASAMISVLIVIMIAVVVTSIKSILDFVGAFASAYISFVVPPLWVIQVSRRQKGFSWFSAEVLCSLALFSVGAFFFVFGTYSAIRDALQG